MKKDSFDHFAQSSTTITSTEWTKAKVSRNVYKKQKWLQKDLTRIGKSFPMFGLGLEITCLSRGRIGLCSFCTRTVIA
jgi:hypothetical protein